MDPEFDEADSTSSATPQTIADEQRARSEKYQSRGIHAAIEANDERPEDQRPIRRVGALPIGDTLDSPSEGQRQVTGVSTPVKEDGKLAS